MKMNKTIFAAAAAAVLVISGTANAGILFSLTEAGSFEDGGGKPGAAVTNGRGPVIQVDVSMQMTGLAANEDFAATTFNVELGPGLSFLDEPAFLAKDYRGWQPKGGNFLFNGDSKPYWANNSDAGSSSIDARGILVQSKDSLTSLLRQYGEAVRPLAGQPEDDLGFPTFIGSVFLRWDGGVSSVRITPGAGNALATYPENGAGAGVFTATTEGFDGGEPLVVPEPSTMLLTVFGLVGLAGIRRRRNR